MNVKEAIEALNRLPWNAKIMSLEVSLLLTEPLATIETMSGHTINAASAMYGGSGSQQGRKT